MEPHALNLRHLRAVIAITEGGSIAAAVRAVNLTQPAITQGIAKLETQTGLRLFDRRASGMVPTAAAAILTPRAVAALRLIGNRHATSAQIRAFLALAQAGSYAGAAILTGLSEASLHRAVGDLSLGTGQRLVERRGKSVLLTARGIAIARNLRLATGELRSALEELEGLRGRETGRLVIGAMPLSRARLLPHAVVAFHAANPHVEIAIVEGSHAELVNPLRDGEIDMMVGAQRSTKTNDDLVQRPLFTDRPVILGRAGHPLASRALASIADKIDPSRLADYPWVISAPGTPLHSQWQAMFERAGVAPPRVGVACGSVMMARQMLIESNFLTLLSPDQVSVEIEAGWLVRIADTPGDISRTIGVITRADWRPTPLQARFLAQLDSSAKELR
ncbi:LysR family transcriptional regulator [Sphingobium sp. SCG-1]|uniref:LysR family transcriptional regulator n=1 Tax=Sphingobium sp. SCG-1 TaxID=2072936 RepID=UPI000CD6AAD4|nr:LysR family transcriptional regulator [Sphingobium sp. SCG-1]AUW59645.1 LysR family transcriptional regulator [Sphingobium sp. SCG-1]